jgi:hypothetical protein
LDGLESIVVVGVVFVMEEEGSAQLLHFHHRLRYHLVMRKGSMKRIPHSFE